MEASDAFMRIHFAKVKLNKDDGKFEIIDNFNKVSFTATISEDDRNYLKVVDVDDDTSLFSVVKTSEDGFTIRSPWGENLGFVSVYGIDRPEGPTSTEILNNQKEVRFQATRMPLIKTTNEFQVTAVETNDVVGRINAVRLKAVMSMQPDLEAIHRVRIVASSLVLLGIYNHSW